MNFKYLCRFVNTKSIKKEKYYHKQQIQIHKNIFHDLTQFIFCNQVLLKYVDIFQKVCTNKYNTISKTIFEKSYFILKYLFFPFIPI